MIEVNVESLAFDSNSRSPVVILKDADSDRVLPIWIGPGEASAIAMYLGGMDFQRPLTHDLAVLIVGGLGGTLQRVLITRVENSTYFAEIIIDKDGQMISIDARPSDSIALALRAEASIFADEALLGPAAEILGNDHRPDQGGNEPKNDGMSGEDLEEYLRNLRPEDLGRFDP